jgi:hypothetical protein
MKKSLLFIVLATLIAGCVNNSSEERDDLSQSPFVNQDERLTRFFESLKEPNQYQVFITHESADSSASYYVAFDAPNKMYTKTISQDQTTEYLYIDNEIYLKTSNHEDWYRIHESTLDEARKFASFDIRQWGDRLTQVDSNLTYRGEVFCGSSTCHVYETAGASETAVIKFDTTQYRLREVILNPTTSQQLKLNYEYKPEEVRRPKVYQNQALPGAPTEDIKKLETIYTIE